MIFRSPIIEVKSLVFRRNNLEILKGINFHILKGDYCAIIGPNGGGKSTLARLILSLEKPYSGEIKIFNKRLKDFRDFSKIGYVPQHSVLIDSTFPATVYEIVSMGRYGVRGLFNRESDEDRAAIDEAMRLMGVSELSDRLIGRLSGGQRQRVMIARALASNPEILIVDEPNTGVDQISQGRFYELLRELNQKRAITIIFITHDIGVIAEDITRVLFVNQTLLTSSNPADLMRCDEMSRLYANPLHVVSHNH